MREDNLTEDAHLLGGFKELKQGQMGRKERWFHLHLPIFKLKRKERYLSENANG